MDLPAIQQEIAGLKTGLMESQKGLSDLFNVIKSFKDTTVSDLATNTDKLVQAINGSTQAQGKASTAYDALTQKIATQAKAAQEINTTIASNSASYETLIKAAVRNKLALDELSQSQKQAKKNYDDTKITLEQYTSYLESIRTAQTGLKISNADITKGLNNLERQAQASGGSIDELRAKLNLLNQTYDKLSTAERDSEGGQGLLKNIQDVDAALKQLEGDSGRFQRNVGNYSGAFKEAFKVLQDQLAATKTQMKDLTGAGTQAVNKFGFDPNRHKDVSNKTGASAGTSFVATENLAQFDTLASKAEVLESNIERLGIGFKSTRQESRAFAEAATQVGLALGLESEEFQTFDKALGHSQNAINDIKAASKFQASDAKFIVGLANAASTLAGGFGAASAASSLFAGDNVDLQKQMAKFQELLVLINGLQAVANGLQAEAGGMQLLLSARTNLLNAAKATQLLLTTRAIQVIAAETAETTINAEVKEVATEATGEQAVAEGVQTAALAANTEATVVNTAAQTAAKGAGLGTIAIAAGIAAVAIGAGVALALLTAKLLGYKGAAGLTTDQQKELAKAAGDLNDALSAQAKVFDDLDVSQKSYYTNLIQNAQDAGASQYALLLVQQQFDKLQADNAKLEVDRLGATDAGYSAQAQKVQKLLDLQALNNEQLKGALAVPESEQTKAQKKTIETNTKLAELYAAQLAPEQKRLDEMTNARKNFADFTQKQVSDETKFTKLALDEQLAYTQKTEELRANLVKARNAIVIADERSSLRVRVSAMKSTIEEENKILSSQATQIKQNPSNFINGLLTPQAQGQVDQLNNQRRQNLLKGAEDIRKLTKQVTDQQKDDALEAFKDQQDAIIHQAQRTQQGKNATYDLLNGSTGTSIGERSAAIGKEAAAQAKILEAERDRQLQKARVDQEDNQEKIKDINLKYDNDINKLHEDALQKYFDLEGQALKESLGQWDKYYAKRKEQIDENESEEIVALNARNLNDRHYAQQREKIEDNAAVARAQIAVQDAEVQRNATKDGTKERIEANDKLFQGAKALSDSIRKQGEDGKKTTKENLESTLTEINAESQNYANAIGAVLDISYNTQKVHLEELEARQQRAYEQQVKNISDSGATQEQQAIRLRILDTQRATQKEATDRKQKQLDTQKAQFDKAKDILGIITGTALAVVKALPNIPLAVSVGILGGAELAAAIATPIPHYKEGIGLRSTGEHPGGPAVVGDGGVKELILEPGKAPRWSASTPTIESLMAHTKVIPPHKIDEMMMSGMFVNHQGAIVMQASDNKKELRELKEAVIWNAHEIKSALAKNRGRTVINNRIDTNWGSYLNSKVFDKR